MFRDTATQELRWSVTPPEIVVVDDSEKLVGEKVPASRFSRDFDSGLFSIHTPHSEIHHMIASYLGEKLFIPRYEEIRIGYDGSLDADYVDFMTRSIIYWRECGDYQASYRFEMELQGMRQLAWLVSQQVTRDRSTSARHIIGSDPGLTYATEEGAKSVIFTGEVKRLTPTEIIYGQIAVPLELLKLLTLFEKIQQVADFEQAAELTGVALTEVTAESLVAYAVPLIGSLNEVAEVFGQGSWDEIVKKAQDQLRLENDPLGRERREGMINYYAELIYQALHESRDHEYLNIIDESMRRVFALEAGADEMLGLGVDQVKSIIDRSLIDVKAEQIGIFSKTLSSEQIAWFENHYDVTLSEVMRYRGWMENVFRTNPMARRALVTGCGGGRSFDFNSNPRNGVETMSVGYGYETQTAAGLDMVAGFGYQETSTESDTLKEGDTACYRCPVCESEGHNPGGEVKLSGGYLVCQDKPDLHKLQYSSSG